MQNAIQISFHDSEASAGLERDIRKKVERLERYFPRITSVRTVLTRSTARHRRGNLFHVRIDLTLPGAEIVIDRDSDLNHAHEDPYVAIRDAFRTARRQLQDYVRSHFRKSKRPKDLSTRVTMD